MKKKEAKAFASKLFENVDKEKTIAFAQEIVDLVSGKVKSGELRATEAAIAIDMAANVSKKSLATAALAACYLCEED